MKYSILGNVFTFFAALLYSVLIGFLKKRLSSISTSKILSSLQTFNSSSHNFSLLHTVCLQYL